MSNPGEIGAMSVPPRHEADARAQGATMSFGSFRLDRVRRLLLKEGAPVRIGSRALDLLIVLIDRAGDVVSRHELLELVWPGVVVEEAGVRVHIATLRRTLGDGQDGARYIVNVAGRGYSFVAPITRDRPDLRGLPAGPPTFRSTSDVPSLPRSLIGREDVVKSLGELLLRRRFVSVVGAGGIGKTTVALAIAQELRPEFGAENVVFVSLGDVLETGLIAPAVISVIGATIGGTDPITELQTYLADKRMLIIFDSCEHLVEPMAQLTAQIFQSAPGVHLLITSRESLRVEGETVHLLSPLAYPADEFPTAAEALATPAVELFMERAKSGGFHEGLTDMDAPIVSEICRRADGIALAIELAASRAGTYGIRGVANLLATNAKLRLVGRRNVAPRHQTLEAMLDWSFMLLAESDQKVLCRLSAFVGLFTIEAACAVAGDDAHSLDAVAAALVNLVDKSLVWVKLSDGAVYYCLPDTTRAFAAAKLKRIENAQAVVRRHALYFVGLFKAIALEHGNYADVRPHAPHIANVREALRWSFSTDERHAIGVALAADTAPLFLGLCQFTECRHWALAALRTIETLDDMADHELRLQEALALSSLRARGNSLEVRAALERALSLSQSEGNELPQLRLIAGLEIFLTRLGDFEGALTAAKRFAVIAGRTGERREQALAEWMLASTHHLAADQVAAANHCERGFQLAADIDDLDLDLFGYSHALRAMLCRARVLWNRGAPRRACEYAHEVMDEGGRRLSPTNYCISAVYAVPVLFWSGNTDGCFENLERVIFYAERYSLATYGGVALTLKGEGLTMTGNPTAGVHYLQQGLDVLHREKHRIATSAATRALAVGLALCGKHQEAIATIDEAISSTQEMGQKIWLPDLHRTQGEIVLKGPCADAGAAERAFRKSIELAGEQGAMGWELKAAIQLACLLREQGRHAETRGILEPIFLAHTERSGTRDVDEAAQILASLDRPTNSD